MVFAMFSLIVDNPLASNTPRILGYVLWRFFLYLTWTAASIKVIR